MEEKLSSANGNVKPMSTEEYTRRLKPLKWEDEDLNIGRGSELGISDAYDRYSLSEMQDALKYAEKETDEYREIWQNDKKDLEKFLQVKDVTDEVLKDCRDEVTQSKIDLHYWAGIRNMLTNRIRLKVLRMAYVREEGYMET